MVCRPDAFNDWWLRMLMEWTALHVAASSYTTVSNNDSVFGLCVGLNNWPVILTTSWLRKVKVSAFFAPPRQKRLVPTILQLSNVVRYTEFACQNKNLLDDIVTLRNQMFPAWSNHIRHCSSQRPSVALVPWSSTVCVSRARTSYQCQPWSVVFVCLVEWLKVEGQGNEGRKCSTRRWGSLVEM